MYTILQISDLHRTGSDAMTNEDIVSALICDFDRSINESPPVSKPDVVIVSGDIIKGAKLNEENTDDLLNEQYAEAADLLNRISTEFTNHDNSKIIIVPGNHDVDWNTSFDSMKKVEKAPFQFEKILKNAGTKYRWSWKDRDLFKINDENKYKQRFHHYKKFIKQFYFEVPTSPLIDTARNWNIFLNDNQKIAICSFNSCIECDCFNGIGNISSSDISNCHLTLRDYHTIKLKIAVWHHNTIGNPRESDYLDTESLSLLVDKGFRLGCHGHQHKPDTIPYTINLGDDYSMSIISAGSLCAGISALPHAQNRTYNVIQIHDDYNKATIHVREMLNSGSYSKGRINRTGGKSFIDVNWTNPPEQQIVDTSRSGGRNVQIIGKAEQFYSVKDFSNARKIILTNAIFREPGHGKKLAVQILNEGEFWEDLSNFISNPETEEELILLANSLIKQKKISECESQITSANLSHDSPPKKVKNLVDPVKSG